MDIASILPLSYLNPDLTHLHMKKSRYGVDDILYVI